ncbi:Calcium-responsive transcription factor [Trinorchestia longiramus]|nr:Calcium-responsive transcription factor [Trinorchestia longiramus]
MNYDDTSSSDDSDCGPLWESSDDSDSDEREPVRKKAKKAWQEDSDKTEATDVQDAAAEGDLEMITMTVDENGDACTKLFEEAGQPEISTNQESQEIDSNGRDPYEVRRFSSLRDVITYMDHYQQETLTHFTSFSRHGAFGNEKQIPNVQRGRIYFESLKGKCGMPITYDGVPFIHMGRWSFTCHQGIDRNHKQKKLYLMKRKERCKQEGMKLEMRNRVSKKVNCPAEIYISHVVKFPQHAVCGGDDHSSLPSDQVRRNVKRKLSEQYKHNPANIVCEHWYYVRIPMPWAHKGHPVLATVDDSWDASVPVGAKVTLNTDAVARLYDKRKNALQNVVVRTKEPVDPRVLDKIRELYKDGMQDERCIREAIAVYVDDELLAGKSKPPSIFRRFNPTNKDIANEIVKAKEELRAERVRQTRSLCSSLLSEAAHLLPAVEDETSLQAAHELLTQLYETVKAAVPDCISNPEEHVVTETTIGDKDTSCSSILLSDPTAIVIPQTITVQHQPQQLHAQPDSRQQQHISVQHHQLTPIQHHQQQPQHHQHQQHRIQIDNTSSPVSIMGPTAVLTAAQDGSLHSTEQHTITYADYATVQPLCPSMSAINTAGVATVHTISPNNLSSTITTLQGSHQPQQTYEIAAIQPNGALEYRDRKITQVQTWYQ